RAPGLKSTAEFQRLAKDIPSEGNGFSFTSRRFGETVIQLQRQALSRSANTPAPLKELMESLLAPDKATFGYAVVANTSEGWLSAANGNRSAANAFLAAPVAVTAVSAGMLLPALAKAKQRAQNLACINNLRQIELAKKMWATDNNKGDTATPARSDLSSYLSSKGFLTCPGGGSYTINSVGEPPECSVAGHKLPAR
ncbi:MAG: hypothetical protein DME25_00900, partial [Verrucomicrobia bacterium]